MLAKIVSLIYLKDAITTNTGSNPKKGSPHVCGTKDKKNTSAAVTPHTATYLDNFIQSSSGAVAQAYRPQKNFAQSSIKQIYAWL
jgi:hypothetical protein